MALSETSHPFLELVTKKDIPATNFTDSQHPIDQIITFRFHGRSNLIRIQEKTRDEDGTLRVLLKGPPSILARLEGYTFATKARELLILTSVQLVSPPDGGEAWIAFADAKSQPLPSPCVNQKQSR